MLKKTFPIAAATALIVVLYLAETAQAKGPFEVVISGGGLSRDVVIPVQEIERLMSERHGIFGPPYVSPHTFPTTTAYNVDLRVVQPNGQRDLMMSLTYYPAQGAESARVWDTTGWLGIDPAFEELLNRYIGANGGGASAPSSFAPSGGPPSEAGGIPLWFAVAGGLAAVLGSGLLVGAWPGVWHRRAE